MYNIVVFPGDHCGPEVGCTSSEGRLFYLLNRRKGDRRGAQGKLRIDAGGSAILQYPCADSAGHREAEASNQIQLPGTPTWRRKCARCRY